MHVIDIELECPRCFNKFRFAIKTNVIMKPKFERGI